MSISLTRTTDGTLSNANANLNNNWTAIEAQVNDLPLADIAQGGATTNDAMIWTGSTWAPVRIANAQIAAGAGISPSKIAPGSDGQILKTVAATTAWSKTVSQQRNTTSVDTPENTATNDLQTITIGAGALAIGDVVHIRAGGTMSGSAGTRTINLVFGATTLVQFNASGSSAKWLAEACLAVSGASAQVASASIGLSLQSPAIDRTAPAEAIAGSIIVKTSGQTSNVGDEITSDLLVVSIEPA